MLELVGGFYGRAAGREQKVKKGKKSGLLYVSDLEPSQPPEIKMFTFITDEIIFMWPLKPIKHN